MNTALDNETLRAHVVLAIDQNWSAFAAEHPALAQVIDQIVLRDYVFETLADDPAFLDAYRAATESAASLNALANVVNGFVLPILKRLL